MADFRLYQSLARAISCQLHSYRDRRYPPADVGNPETAEVVVLVHNSMYGVLPAGHGCALPTGCAITSNRRFAKSAAALVFHIPTLWRLPKMKRRGQVWVGWSMESEANYPQLVDPNLISRLDLMMTYRLDSDMPAIYLPSVPAAEWSQPPGEKSSDRLCAVLISHKDRRSGRVDYVRELMRHMELHSYGKVLNNRTLPVPDEGPATKSRLLRSYKFALAFENSICRDYVTEKLFGPLLAGCVPVYRGAPNLEDFLPGDHCCINVTDFASPQHLAGYLRYLDSDDRAYADYFAWKSRPLRPGFMALQELARHSPGVQLCRELRARLDGSQAPLPSARRAGNP